MIRTATWMTFLAFIAVGCGGGSGDGPTDTTAGTGSGTGSGTGGGTGSGTGTGSGGPSAPVVTDLDCSQLPQALEGAAADDMLIRVGLTIDLDCVVLDQVGRPDTGASFEFLTYQDWDPRVTIAGTFTDRWNVLSASAGTFEAYNYGGAAIWNPPEGEDVTVSLTDANTETRDVEFTFRFEPPYVSFMSVVEN